MKIHSVGAELFHADGRTDGETDMTKLTVGFQMFATAPNKLQFLPKVQSFFSISFSEQITITSLGNTESFTFAVDTTTVLQDTVSVYKHLVH